MALKSGCGNAENQSEHSETAANKENNSEITEEESIDSEKEEDEMTTYIAKIPEFNGEDIETSPQEWLDQVTKAGDANGWNAARMLRTIPYFLKETAEECNAAANEQKAITAMYTEAEVEGKTIHLILDSGSARSIITYQLMQQLKRNVDRPAQTVIVTADGMKKTPVGEIDNFPFTLDGITIPVKVLVPAICGTFNKHSEKAPAFEFELEEEKPLIKTFMALGSMSNWANETEQEHFTLYSEPETSEWNIPYSKPEPRKQCPYIPLKYMLLEECNWIDVAIRGGVCDQICQYALSISEKVKRGTPFNAAYNSAFNKLYHYPYDAEMIFDLAMALINRATKENVRQMKEAEYIEYTMELAGFDYEDEVKVYHQITSHTYPTQEAQIQQLEQMNIRLCEECIMPCNKQWCPECYALSIPLPSKNDEYKIEFGELEVTEEIKTTPIYLIENQPALQLKYFNNNGQGIKPEKAHKIDAGYDLRYSGKDTLTLKPKFLTKINLKIALKIPPGAMVQIASQSSLASKEINVRGGIIDAEYTGDITLGKSEKETQGFGSTERFTVPVNIALNEQKESHQILQLLQPITISLFGEHSEIYICEKSTTTQQIFESNEQICLKHNISIPNIYIPEETKKVRITFYNPNNYLIVLLNNLEIGIIHSNIFQQELPQTVLNFSEIIGHSLPKINPNPSSKNYHVVMEKLSQINMGQLEPQQQTQLKELIAEFADIFAENNNDLERTDLVQHQIYTGDAKPRRQQEYQVAPESHQFI
ncbi:hypothetical protein G9A89_009083 [Geosiphon pyriformis]|nr:hypothetical protein G9A89_009083 [Geosiphon pyriformis]